MIEQFENPIPAEVFGNVNLAQILLESLGDPYHRQVPLPRIPKFLDLHSKRYPKDTFSSKLPVKSQQHNIPETYYTNEWAPFHRKYTRTIAHNIP